MSRILRAAGFIFSPSTPFNFLVASNIASISAEGIRPTVGDWGAGHGYLSQIVFLAGGNPQLIERSKKVAQESLTAMKTQKDRFSLKDFLPEDVLLKTSTKAFVGSILLPPTQFMSPQRT